MTRRVLNKTDLKLWLYSFEQVENLKYLGVNIKSKNIVHYEIKLRISVVNKANLL